MSKALWINALHRSAAIVEVNGLRDLQERVGGHVECAFHYPSGDVLFVDEEGLLKGLHHGFLLPERSDQVLMGNGVIVGPEVDRGDGGWWHTDVTLTVADVLKRIQFVRQL